MYGITVTVKLQNKLAKDSIVMSLKNMSEESFNENGGLLLYASQKCQILK